MQRLARRAGAAPAAADQRDFQLLAFIAGAGRARRCEHQRAAAGRGRGGCRESERRVRRVEARSHRRNGCGGNPAGAGLLRAGARGRRAQLARSPAAREKPISDQRAEELPCAARVSCQSTSAVPHFELSPVETRILGCLLEKERLTPENYPISLNSLTAACNQSTNREPVTSYEERAVDDGLTALREKKLAIMIHAAGSRVQKYRHNLPPHYELSRARWRSSACSCCAARRRPASCAAHGALSLFRQPGGDGRRAPGAGGRRRSAGAPAARARRPERAPLRATPLRRAGRGERAQEPEPPRSRLDLLELEVAGLRAELGSLREQFEKFRQQFE